MNKQRIIKSLCSKVRDKDDIVQLFQLYLTGKCQLNCRYCNPGEIPDMDSKTALEIMDKFISSTSGTLRIQFFGGEPLLKYDIIKKVTDYIKTIDRDVELLIATNGVLLTEEKIKFFGENNFSVVFSFDGLQHVQDKNRPSFGASLYGVIEAGLERLVKSEVNFFVNMVVGPDNLDSLSENVHFLVRKGVKNIRLSYMMGAFWKMDDIKRYYALVEKLYNECASMKPAVRITACKDEPVLISSGLAVTADKKMYVGTTFPLSHCFPHLKEINYYGNLDEVNVAYMRKNKRKEVQKALEITSQDDSEFSLMANNIFMGINYEKLFENLENENVSN